MYKRQRQFPALAERYKDAGVFGPTLIASIRYRSTSGCTASTQYAYAEMLRRSTEMCIRDRNIPDCRVCIGHGQMEPEKLEKIIFDFVKMCIRDRHCAKWRLFHALSGISRSDCR